MTFSIALEIVLFCKNWFMSHVYLSCFDYQENYVFFLKLIQTHISASQGSIRFEKNAKIKMLKILEGIFYLLFKMNRFSTWRKPSDPSFVGAVSLLLRIRFSKWRKLSDPSLMGALSRFCKMTQTIPPFIYEGLQCFVLESWWSFP